MISNEPHNLYKVLHTFIWEKSLDELLSALTYKIYKEKIDIPIKELISHAENSKEMPRKFRELLAFAYLRKAQIHEFVMAEYALVKPNLKRAVRLTPQNPFTKSQLYHSLIENELDHLNINKAMALWAKAKEENIELDDEKNLKQLLELKANDRDKARSLLKNSNELKKSEIYYDYYSNPKKSLEILTNTKETPEKLELLFYCYRSLGKPQKALEIGRELMATNYDSINLYFDCISIYCRLGQIKKSFDILEEMMKMKFTNKLYVEADAIFFQKDTLWKTKKFHKNFLDLWKQEKVDVDSALYYPFEGDTNDKKALARARVEYHKDRENN